MKMGLVKRIKKMKIIILAALLFLSVIVRIGIIIWENNNLESKFIINSDEPYQEQIPISKEDFIDDYIYRLYSPFAEAPIVMPNDFVLKQSISYYSEPDDNLEPLLTLDAGKTYMIRIFDTRNYKYGIKSWPTYEKGWRFVIPFFERGYEKLDASAYYVKLKDLYSPLMSIMKEINYSMPKGYDHRRILLNNDEMLYAKGFYMSPDLQKPVFDGWNIILLICSFCLVIIQIILV